MNIIDLVTIRTMNQSDIHFLLDSSIQSLSKYTESIFKGYTRENIHSHLEFIVLYALKRVDLYSVFLCVHKDSPEDIIGYIVADTTSNHILFQYTKYSYRKLGIQKNLLMPLVVDEKEFVTVNWPTKQMLLLAKQNKIQIVNKFVETLIKEIT